MAFKKGDPKPKGSGAKKGTKYKKTKEWEAFGKLIIENGVGAYAENLELMLLSDNKQDAAEGMKRFEAIMEYFRPKLSRAELGGLDGKDLTLNIVNYDSTKQLQA